MSLAKPRTRLVYFRISEEEFSDMLQACNKIGARSISELARCAVREYMLNRVDQHASIAEMRIELARLLDELKSNLQQITAASAPTRCAEQASAAGGSQIATESAK